ncbi:MAG: NADPH-dependent F420 reductase, partial [Actinomycetota bacterium]
CGDDADAKAAVGAIAEAIPGLRWVDCGPLAQARIVEQLTAVLISVNRTYRLRGAGFRLTGRDAWGRADG